MAARASNSSRALSQISRAACSTLSECESACPMATRLSAALRRRSLREWAWAFRTAGATLRPSLPSTASSRSVKGRGDWLPTQSTPSISPPAPMGTATSATTCSSRTTSRYSLLRRGSSM